MNNKNKHIIFGLSLVCLTLLAACQQNKKGQQNEEALTYPTIGYLEKLDDHFDKIVPPNTKIEVIATEHNWSEGPVWVASEQCLLYSDVPENIVYKWTEAKGAEKYLTPSGYTGEGKAVGSNGLTLDGKGNLILCQSGDRAVACMKSTLKDPKSNFQILTNQYEGKKFNAPNDIVMDKKGNFYFTDPGFGLKDTTLKEMNYQGVFKISSTGEVQLLTKNCPTPNGIGLSPDESKLYVANSRPPKLFAWDLAPDGKISNEQLLFDASELWGNSISKQPPDGMAVNKRGIIFMTGPDGVLVITPKGKHLGTIRTDKRTSNCTFNEDETVLYVTCDDLVLRVILK